MDLPAFILAEHISGTIAPVDTNPTEPPHPGTMHYLVTMHHDGRSFATHVSAPVGEVVDLHRALRVAGERARRLDQSQTHEDWLRASQILDEPDDPLRVDAAHAGEVDLWRRAQQAEAQALRTFLGEVAYRRLLDTLTPLSLPPGAIRVDPERPRRARVPRRRWWLGALAAGGVLLAVPAVRARLGSRRSTRSALHRIVTARS